MEKVQFKLTIETQLRDRLDLLAKRCGYDERTNEFAVELLEQYAEALAHLLKEQIDAATVIRQRQLDQIYGMRSQDFPPERK